jgi:hypothetical protein
MTNGAAPQQYHQDHKALSITIDGLFVETAFAQSDLMGHLCIRVGNIRDYYLPFYRSFMALYTMTSGHKEMEPYADLSGKVKRWGTPSNHIDPSKCMVGITLFFEWKDALFKSGILSMKK